MPHCIVTSHPDYLKLLKESGLKEPILKAKISVWQEKTGNLDRFPTLSELNSVGKQYQKLTAEEKAKTIEQITKEHRSITALKDLAHKLAHRVGGKVEFVNRTDVDWKGYNQGVKSVLNEAYMTPDTPFHEILAHPIIRAIKNSPVSKKDGFEISNFEVKKDYKNNTWYIDFKPGYYRKDFENFKRSGFSTRESAEKSLKNNYSELYQSLLKELETGRGKEVFEQVKRDYKYKKEKYKTGKILLDDLDFDGEGNPQPSYSEEILERDGIEYTLEDQQEEALNTLLGLMAADKLDKIKDATLISKLKELWKQISDFVKSLLRQDGIKIDELPITTTLNDLAEIMAYGNNKIILPGYKVEYSTPLGNKYDTLEEVNAEIRGLADANVEVDLSGVKLKDKNKVNSVDEIKVDEFAGVFEDFIKVNGKWYNQFVFDPNHDYSKDTPVSDKEIIAQWNSRFDEVNEYKIEKGGLEGFIERNKEYEQSKEIIEQWKKENNIQYDPEEVYSRGQGFYSSIGAYSNLELGLLLKNLIQHIEDNKKAGGEFTISAFTKPIDKRLKHIEGTGDRVRFVIYPQSEHIKWAAPTDVYSGSVWDAHEKVSKDKKSELLGVSFTKAPALRNINEISPNLADIIDNLSHAHNELGIELTTNNFRIEYDDNIDYSTKKLIDNINKILDDKYGKLVKPEISAKEVGQKYEVYDSYENKVIKSFSTEKEAINYMQNELPYEEYRYSVGSKKKIIGKQPTQTRENTTSIESVHSKVYLENRTIERKINNINEVPKIFKSTDKSNKEVIIEKQEDGRWVGGILGEYKYYFSEDKVLDAYNKSLGNIKEKEYTSQAETNLKIAALKEVARKYPRSLVTSKVVPINPNMVDNSEIQYSKKENINNQKVGSPDNLQYQFKLVDLITPNIDRINKLYSQLGNTDTFWNKLQKDLQIPKEQVALLRESEGNTIGEKLTSFLANYSYTVEIKTAEDDLYKPNPWETETEDQKKIREEIGGVPTQYYSNLTVPGGTNYTENEIATPAITPSIKGHAQFATDNGIGWFRSDEQVEGGKYEKGKIDRVSPDGTLITNIIGEPTKTRRILEVQSDLFQKGRDKHLLVNYTNDLGQNQFLQLLNKDNNWVTFFIKSIVQDSAKKGYEKVLFPKGETAAKVEGHETIAEEIRRINDDINKIKTEGKSVKYQVIDETGAFRAEFTKIEEAEDYLIDNDIDGSIEYFSENIEILEKRKQELKSQGVEKLKPIEAFYEIKVGNILEKQFGKDNVKTITDEYGNTWNEVTIKKEHLSPVVLSYNPQDLFLNNLKKQLRISGTKSRIQIANINEKIAEINKSYNIVLKLDVSKIGQSDSFKLDLKLLKNSYHKYLSEKTLKDVLEKVSSTNTVMSTLAKKLLNKIDGVEKVAVEYISNEEFRKIKGSVVNDKSAAALYIPNEKKIVINIDYINKHPESTIIHEILHAITYHYIRTNDTIAREWQELYNKVKKQFEGDSLYESHALRNADELLTAVFTDAGFIKALAAKPSLLAQRATLWDDVKNFFKNILGLNNIERTLYDDVFEKASEVVDVAAEFNKNSSNWSLFDDMPLAEIQEDELESYIDPRINRAIDKMVNTLSSKKKELNEQYIKGQHADISRRKNLIENSIIKLISKESPIDDLITVGYRDLSLAQKYFNKVDISNWEAAQLMYTIEAIKVLDEDLKGVEMTDEQSAKLSKLRQKALEFSSKFDAFLKTRLEVLSRAKGLEISNIDFASPYTDRNIVSAATYNMGISEIPHLRVGEAIIQNLMRSAQEQIDSFRKERELLIKEVGREAFAKIFDSSGYLITEYKREFFDEERQQIQEANNVIYSETASPEEKRRAESKLLKWFLDNYDYYLTEEGKTDYETELNNVTEDSENDAAAIKEFELRYSWLNQGNIDANGKFTPNKLFIQYKDGVKASGWYKYLKAVPKSIHRDSRYDSIKDTPAYDFYVKKMIEASLKIPHELAVERGSFYKFLKHVKLDAAESIGGLSVFAKTLWKEMKNWTNVDISIAQAEGRDIRLVDEKGRPKGKIPYKAIDEIKVKDPLKLLEDFYKTAVMYEARLDAQSQLDLVGYDLEKLPGYSRNKIGAIRKDMAGNQVLIEGGLTNAINQFRYRKEAALTGKTRTDENIGVVKPTPEEIEAKKAAIKAKREAGIEITPEDYMFNRFSVVKSLDSAIDYTRLLLIGLKPFTATANLLIGLVNNYIYGARNTDFSESNLNWGLKKIFKAYTTGLVAKNKEAFKLANLAEKFGLTETLFEDQGEYQSEFFSKVTKFMMSLQAGGEFVISVQNMLAFMDKIKIKDKSGKERRLYDAYDEFGHWRKDVFGDMPEWENMTVLDGAGTNISKINQLRNRIDEIRDRTQGDYRNPMPAKGKVWGRILAMFRTWLPRAVHERFGSHNPAIGFKGRYRSYGTAFAQSWGKGGLKEALKLLGATSLTTFVKTMNLPVINTMSANLLSKLADTTQRSYDNYLEKLDITELDVQNMRSNIKELQFILFTLMLIAALKALDDDDEQNPMLNFTLNLSNRLYQDLTFFTIPTSFMSIVKDPIPLYASVKGTVDVINALTNYIEDPSKDEYKTGYRKGDSKTWKEITDMLPIWSSWNSTQSVMSQVFSQDAYRYTDKN